MTQDTNGFNSSRFADTPEEAERRFNEFQSKDPFPSILPALLNSADIADYVAATGMIYPFDDSDGRLKSASYRVDILGECVYWDSKGEKVARDIQRGEDIILEPNSIVFVAVQPMFRIPDYIALRFNLKIDHVYKGLLVGTGPLVDPGFVGKLYLPLHNLTANTYVLKGGEPIIWMEFTKLSSNEKWKTEKDNGIRSSVFIGFPGKKERGLEGYLYEAVGLGKTIRSSIPGAFESARQEAAKAAQDANSAKRDAEEAKQNVLNTKSQLSDTLADMKIEFAQLGTTLVKESEVIKAQTEAKVEGVAKRVSVISTVATIIVTILVVGTSFIGIIQPTHNLVKTTMDNMLRAEKDVNILKEKDVKDLQTEMEALQKRVSELENKLNSTNAASASKNKTTQQGK